MTIKSRIAKLEAVQGGYHQPVIQFVYSPRGGAYSPEGMSADEAEAHRQQVREAVANPHAILICYQNMDGTDSLDDLFGPDEAREINSKHRQVKLTRSYVSA
jgi:hypothetical protein